jgi:hypothetical protein
VTVPLDWWVEYAAPRERWAVLQGTYNKYSTRWHRHTFVLLAQRLVLPDQLFALVDGENPST